MIATNRPTPKTEADFFELRKEGKLFVSRVFKVSESSTETRFVKIVFENSSIVIAGEINGILTLRQSEKKKQQVAIIVTQDDKNIR